MLDRERTPPPTPSGGWRPSSGPGDVELLVRAAANGARIPLEATRALLHPRTVVRRGREAGAALVRMRSVVRPTLSSSLNGPVGPHRRWAGARGRLSDVATIRRELGGTVNDVVLACICGGFRDLLIARGEATERVVRTMVPVSVRAPGQRGVYDNRVSAVFADLPVGLADPVARLAAIREQMGELKRTHLAVAGEVLTSLGGFAPPMLLALGERLATRLPQHSVNTVTTNVPGPQTPLYIGGRRMLEALPYVPLGGHVRVGIAIFSYDGALTFGVTGDYDTAPDIDVVCRGIERAMDELLHLSVRQAGATRRESKRRQVRSREPGTVVPVSTSE
jgi:diacylglycerol O-acyltransferase